MRLIDADALMELARNHVNRTVDCNDIARFPTIDAVPVVHARWALFEGFWACSECGCSPADWEQKPNNPYGLPPYCHCCGAKMDGKETEE